MLVIRLSRIGKKAQPSFRVIVQNKQTSPKRKALDIVGFYHPALKPKKVQLEKEKIETWVKNGAIPSDTVASLLKRNGFANMDKYILPRNKTHKSKKEGAPTQAATPAPAPAAA